MYLALSCTKYITTVFLFTAKKRNDKVIMQACCFLQNSSFLRKLSKKTNSIKITTSFPRTPTVKTYKFCYLEKKLLAADQKQALITQIIYHTLIYRAVNPATKNNKIV